MMQQARLAMLFAQISDDNCFGRNYFHIDSQNYVCMISYVLHYFQCPNVFCSFYILYKTIHSVILCNLVACCFGMDGVSGVFSYSQFNLLCLTMVALLLLIFQQLQILFIYFKNLFDTSFASNQTTQNGSSHVLSVPSVLDNYSGKTSFPSLDFQGRSSTSYLPWISV